MFSVVEKGTEAAGRCLSREVNHIKNCTPISQLVKRICWIFLSPSAGKVLSPHSNSNLAEGSSAVWARVDFAIPDGEGCGPQCNRCYPTVSQTAFGLKSLRFLMTKAGRNVVLQLKLGCNQFYAALITLVNRALQPHLNQAVRPELAQQKAP